MNVNNFAHREPNLQWAVKEVDFWGVKMTVLLPFLRKSHGSKLDLREAEIHTVGWTWNCRLDPHSRSVWIGVIKNKIGNSRSNHVLVLEAMCGQYIDSQSHFRIATPYGWPGNPMTILVDRDGEIVPDLYFPSGYVSSFKVLFLKHNWKEMEWDDPRSAAIALQFLEGKYLGSGLAKAKWHNYLMRNSS
jgi:hypothetical protein